MIILKKEGYIMLAELENDPKMFDKAMKFTDSENEIKYISILKAKKLAQKWSNRSVYNASRFLRCR